ncbi:uncharacterized protein LOC144737075 [Lampetra planeri]
MGRHAAAVAMLLVLIVNQIIASGAIPMAERPQRHVDGMFTSELSRMQSARLVQKYAMDILRMRPEREMEEDDDEDEEEALGLTAGGGDPELPYPALGELGKQGTAGEFGDEEEEVIDSFRHARPSQAKHHAAETILGADELPQPPPPRGATW